VKLCRQTDDRHILVEKALMTRSLIRGFSLLEMMAVLGIMMIASAIGFISLQPVLRQRHVTNAYNTTLATMRRAREAAIAERRRYQVTFNSAVVPNTLRIAPADPAPGGVQVTYSLPTDVRYTVNGGLPAVGPDGFGNGSIAIDFDQNIATPDRSNIYFYPDGTAQDVNNNINNGVVYVARPGELTTTMAITLWGTTGRMRGWRLTTAGGPKWNQQ
jgi:prepilin-type N-terminal cleavage/methylation domain-containing protein